MYTIKYRMGWVGGWEDVTFFDVGSDQTVVLTFRDNLCSGLGCRLIAAQQHNRVGAGGRRPGHVFSPRHTVIEYGLREYFETHLIL